MIKRITVQKWHIGIMIGVFSFGLFAQHAAYASPFGTGVFGADVPFGSLTAISIALSSDVDMSPASVGGGILKGEGSHAVTVTSTDVVGYDLYINATSGTAMSNGIDSVAASGNVVAAGLAPDTWGYNTANSSTNFVGITGAQKLINSGTGPFKSGVATTVTYGILTNTTKSSGVYSAGVTYTAVGKS